MEKFFALIGAVTLLGDKLILCISNTWLINFSLNNGGIRKCVLIFSHPVSECSYVEDGERNIIVTYSLLNKNIELKEGVLSISL